MARFILGLAAALVIGWAALAADDLRLKVTVGEIVYSERGEPIGTVREVFVQRGRTTVVVDDRRRGDDRQQGDR